VLVGAAAGPSVHGAFGERAYPGRAPDEG
jgi:hypothetical protein